MFVPVSEKKGGEKIASNINSTWQIVCGFVDYCFYFAIKGHPLFSLRLASSDGPKFLAFSKKKKTK